jgi:hypothetical protein
MSDSVGHLIFSKSENAKINYPSMIQVLNEFCWSNECDDLCWGYDQSQDAIYFETMNVPYPTAHPLLVTHEVEDENGETVFIDHIAMTENDFDNEIGKNVEEANLSEFGKRIGESLTAGWIEISCVGWEKQHMIFFEKIKVQSDRTGVFLSYVGRSQFESSDYIEKF